ncbi:pilus assembly protein N-terminal domain-containing protein [Trinickia sp. EG282A]|uniref:type II and III secretion system protein family protein n=1 Tax=Trinickia sp. EG282A TaxID=3237013 RepID=UPI0034D1D9DD
MNTKLKALRGRTRRRCNISAISAAVLGASLAAAQPAIAQVMVEGGTVLHVTKSVKPMRAMTTAAAPAAAAAPAPATAAAVSADAAASAPQLRGPNCMGEINESQNVVVPVGKSTLVQLAEPTRNRTIGNPAVAMATLVSPRTLYVVGMAVGTTNMIIQGRSGACQMLEVIVGVDTNGLQQSLSQLMPEERGIRVSGAAGNLVLAGRVSSASAAQQAMEIAHAYAGSSQQAGPSVINMMAVDSPQQVMLEVKVAEVAKTLVDQLGSQLNLQGGFGSWTAALATTLLTGGQSVIAASKSNHLPLSAAIDAQKTDQLTKILAEPNLVTVSGQEASFLAGGRVFIPVPQSNSNGGTTITLQEEEFGVGLKFTPTVLGNGRINLKVSPEVSELSPTGVTVSATGSSTTAILPLINTRRASTTVQMSDGESFAIGGLISNNITGALKAFPGLGELPVIGALMRSTNFQQDRTELVFVITPHLVKPLPNSNYPLPTDSFVQPNSADIFATGNMEGRGGERVKPTVPPLNAPNSSTSTPDDSPKVSPAQMDSQTTVPSPTPVPASPTKAEESLLVPREPARTSEVRSDVISSRELPRPMQPTKPAAQHANPRVPSPPNTEDQATRIARIEAAAARIAKQTDATRALTVSSAANGQAKQ